MKRRHQLLSQTSVYLQHNSRDANLSLDDLRSMVDNFTAEQLMNRLQRYAAKVQGSQYWFQRYQELGALIEQKRPTLFWTVSAADNHWPELHKLLPHATEPPTLSMRIQAIIDNPHITDWFFTTKLSDFVQHWLYESLDAEWHWYRLEYQARGSTHAHGCVKLKKRSRNMHPCNKLQQLGYYPRMTIQNMLGTLILFKKLKLQRLLYYNMQIGL